jgi:hypothetical protein
MELTDAEKEFTSLFSGFIFQKRTNSMWGKNKLSEADRIRFDEKWLKKWKTMEKKQLQEMECDYIIYHPLKKTEPIFEKLPFLSSGPTEKKRKKRRAEYPTCSIEVKKHKSHEDETLKLYLTKTMWNNMIQQLSVKKDDGIKLI